MEQKLDNIVEKPTHLENWTLGNNGTEYKSTYDKSLLVPIPRAERRKGYTQMYGIDVWTAFEFSFLLPTGLPAYKVLRIYNDCNSTNIFESKSLKLYLNSYNNTTFDSVDAAVQQIETDLTELTGMKVKVEVKSLFKDSDRNLDPVLENHYTDCKIDTYVYDANLLQVEENKNGSSRVSMQSNLLRSNCEITNQPDWANIHISYIPNKVHVNPESLLKYIVSYRNHQEFHEPTCERIFQDLLKLLDPQDLTVICQYTRRGGIDINPIRTMTTHNSNPELSKLLQQ